jgi:hypothetical protein
MKASPVVSFGFLVSAWLIAMGASPVVARAQDAATLQAKYMGLRGALASNAFQRPLVLESVQNSNDLRGEVYAVVDQPYWVVSPALQGMDHWCDLLILHLNVKNCTFSGKPPAEILSLVVGRKFDQPLDDGYKIDFAFRTPAASADYLQVQMSADAGPMGTKDYRLTLEAVPADERHTFVHMSYSYAYGTMARIAMQTYLATAGRDKVGFSVTGKDSDGKPVYIDGVRGGVERNTVRYFLAIEAYLGSLAAAPAERQEKRLRDWFAATERNALQLHEMTQDDYLAMKHHEIQRQQGGAAGK